MSRLLSEGRPKPALFLIIAIILCFRFCLKLILLQLLNIYVVHVKVLILVFIITRKSQQINKCV
jgi:hypothetical protein